MADPYIHLKGSVEYYIHGVTGKQSTSYEVRCYVVSQRQRKYPKVIIEIKIANGFWKKFTPRWSLDNPPTRQWLKNFTKDKSKASGLHTKAFGIKLS